MVQAVFLPRMAHGANRTHDQLHGKGCASYRRSLLYRRIRSNHSANHRPVTVLTGRSMSAEHSNLCAVFTVRRFSFFNLNLKLAWKKANTDLATVFVLFNCTAFIQRIHLTLNS